MQRRRQSVVGFWRDFQEFALKGNVVDLAVAVIIGGAFGRIVTSFVEDIVMPLVNPLVPAGNWQELTIGPGVQIGSFLSAIVNFVIIALVLFVVIRVLQKLRRKEEAAPPPPTERECPYCFTKIPIAASRCPACTSEVVPVGPIP